MKFNECTIIGANKFYLQDNRDMIKTIPDRSVDLILTDPPYNISKYSTGNIDLPNRTPLNNNIADWDKVEIFPSEYITEFKRILKPSGNVFIFTTYNCIGKWHAAFDEEFDTTQFMVWHKTNPTPNIFKKGFLNSCELIICFWNKGHVWNFTSQGEMHNFIESPICMGAERLKNPKHPSQKPLQVLKHIIKIASNENDMVFDPFMGVASTAVAAIELNRKFCGCEINKAYYDGGVERVKRAIINHNL